MFQKKLKPLCKFIGQRWRYKDYSNWMKENGEAYDFKASRHCLWCDQHEYFSGSWVRCITKSPDDVQTESISFKKFVKL